MGVITLLLGRLGVKDSQYSFKHASLAWSCWGKGLGVPSEWRDCSLSAWI